MQKRQKRLILAFPAFFAVKGILEGAPELVVEIAASSRAYDLHQKKGAYRRNAILEYLVWITPEKRVIWWELREGEHQEIARAPDGLLKSGVVPGLWLDPPPCFEAT